MLIQGTNVPIQVTFDNDVSTFKKIVATLWQGNKLVKQWNEDDMTIAETTITLPLDEDETRNFKQGKVRLEIKGRNSTDQTVFWEETEIQVMSRNDKNIDLIE